MTRAIAIVLPASGEDAVSGALWDLGCTGVTIESVGANVRVVAFFDETRDALPGAAAIARAHGGTLSEHDVPEVDWVAKFRETFRGFDVASYSIVPEWESARSRAAGRTPIVVDPGRAFGTGTHESTRLCLEAFDRAAPGLPSPPRVLDIGCGTSILAIAAAKRTGCRPVACDLDPEAIASTWRHADLNGVVVDALVADGARGLRSERFDVVFANLMAPLLTARAREIGGAVAPGGFAILAGLLGSEADDVARAWPADWRRERSDLGEWACLAYARP